MEQSCFADISGPFYDPAKPFRNWSALPFYQLDLALPPYVDHAQLAWGLQRAQAYLERIHAQGYTGIVIDNLAHLVSFERAPVRIYAPDSPYRQRAVAYRAAFGHLFDAATRRGMQVFVTADMQWSTPPVRRYVGRLSARNPRLADINRWALEELFTTLPQVHGLVVRVGETGGAHDQGASYTGHMLYTTTRSLRALIQTLLPVCERHDRLLVIRTWSIGIGELGDLLWSPERYREVFAGYTSPHLLVSIKHGPSDFFRLLPHNPTLGLAGPRQIIELQNRREYELFGMIPSSVASLHQEVLGHARATNGRCVGVWAWNSSGGWGGGQAALGTAGWSLWTELSSALTAALVRAPEMDTTRFVHTWCCAAFGPAFGTAVAEVYLESAAFVERGWYLGRFAHGAQTLGSIYLPTLLWVWWMRPTASLIVWAYLASTLPDPDAICQEGSAICARVADHGARLARLAPAGDTRAAALVESVRYFADVLAVAHAIRTFMLRLFAAAWAADRAQWHACAASVAGVQAALHAHQAAWNDRTDFPALELDEIEAFLSSLNRAPHLLWLRARMACLLVQRLRAGQKLGRHIHKRGMFVAALLVLLLFYEGHPRVGTAGAVASMLLVSPLRRHAVRALLPWLSQHLNLLPSIFFETGPSFTEWTA